MSSSPGKTTARIIEVDGREREQEIEWSIESLQAIMSGPYRIVSSHKGGHVLEIEDWHFNNVPQNMAASVLCGRMLHGRVVIVKEPSRL